jgi:SPP1 family predicted phage head-tail adaptor
VRAGRLRNRMRLERPVETRSASGDVIRTWALVTEIWAELVNDPGTERFTAQTDLSEVPQQIRIRYRTGVAPQQRLTYRGRVFRIEALADPDARTREQLLQCVEVLAK